MRLPFRRRQVAAPDTDLHVRTGIEPSVVEFWAGLTGAGFSPRLISNVWCANRCIQLNAQQIASMPLRFLGTSEPAWVTNPDPVWYPNGIGEAVFSAAWSMYGWGDAFLYITGRYASGLPAAWTVLDPAQMSVQLREGRREYESGGVPLRHDDVVQVSRNPNGGLRGSSALAAFAPHLLGSQASAELSRQIMGENPVPHSVLKSMRKLTKDQAETLQAQWSDATATRRGMPAVLPPEIDFQQLAFSPRDLLLLEAQEFNAKVVASAFGVPAFMLNLTLEGGLVYQNPEILFDYWWRGELRPASRRISDALSSQMLPRGSSVHFDARDTLQPGMVDWHKIWSEALTAGAVNVDEYRRAVLNLGPMAPGEDAVDELLQPMSAGASPSDQPTPDVIALRPNMGVMQ